MRFFNKTKGAISIFLVIIMVPMLTLSGLFVDAGRVKLSRSVMDSAGDLAMNTALTNYDIKLKELYGLFATAQDKEDLFAKLEDYYRSCIISAGIDGVEADSYVSYIMKTLGMISEEETSDVLNMHLVDFAISEVENANMANATILKNGIVNFMKYRGPINMGLSFLSSLQSFTSLSKSTELVEKRQEYYEVQQSVLENCRKAWNHIRNYNKNDMLKSETYFDDFKNEAKQFKEKYTNIGRKVIKDLYDTQKHAGNPLKPLKDYGFKYTSDAATIQKKINDFNTALNRLNTKEDKVKKHVYPDGAYDLQYLVQGNREDIFKDYYYAMERFNEAYQDLLYAINNEVDKVEYIDEFDNVKTKEEKVGPRHSTTEYEKIFKEKEKFYNELNKKLSRIANDIADKVNPDETNAKIVELYNKFIKFQRDLTDAKNNLDNALKYLNKVYNAVKPGGSLDEKKNEWEATTKADELANSSLAKQDAAEIKGLSSFIKAEEVKKFIDRLNNISTNLGNMLSELDKFTFFGAKLSELDKYETLKQAIERKLGRKQLVSVPIKETELDSKINTWVQDCFTEGNVNADWINAPGSKIKLIDDKLNFYVFLYTKFNLADEDVTSSEDNAKKLDKKLKNKLKQEADNEAKKIEPKEENGTREILDKQELPSKLNVGGRDEIQSVGVLTDNKKAVSETTKSLSSMFINLGKALKNAGTTLRDDIYISDYIMSMFSYDTIEKEYKHDHPDVSDPKSMLKTLTKNQINEDHNYAYKREVEYIIFGGKNSSNVNKAYGSIFGIRLAFNLIYAFTDSEIRDGAMAIAIPISAATLGVVPAPLIQACIIIGISIIESALDIKDLRDGKPVPLFKNQQTWRVSFTNVVNVIKQEATEILKETAKNSIDEAKSKLDEFLEKTDEELQELINSGSEKVTGLLGSVQDSFKTMVERHANTAIQKFTTLVNDAIQEAKMDPSINKVEYVKQELDKWLAEEKAMSGEDSLTYLAKSEAVNIIKEKLDTLVGEFENAINSALQASEKAIVDIGVALQDEVNKLRQAINKKLENGTAKINEYREKMKQEVKESINQGAEALRNKINEKLDGVFGIPTGSSGGGVSLSKGDSTGMASLLSFQYSDYLRLFTIVGLLANPNAILLRTADAIQCNMQLVNSDDSYRLKDAVAYVEVNATVQVKPLFLALPIFADVESNPKDDSNWYTIKYKGIKGY